MSSPARARHEARHLVLVEDHVPVIVIDRSGWRGRPEDTPVPMKQRVVATWSDEAEGWLVVWPDGEVEQFEKLDGVHKAIEKRAQEGSGGGWMVTNLEIRGSAWQAAVETNEES